MPTASNLPSVEFQHVTKRFRIRDGATLKEFVPALIGRRAYAPPFAALRDVSLAIYPGEALGVIGRNGNGKSTLLKLIAGVMAPTEGRVLVRGRVCPIIELGTGFHPDLTGRENIFLNASMLGMSNREVRQRFDEIVDFSGIPEFLDTPLKHYSSGMYLRLAFSVAVHCDPDILLVDEAMAVGDELFQEKCLERMREFPARGTAVVFVSHSLDMVEQYCSRAVILDHGSVVAEGEPAAMALHYHGMLAAAQA